MYGVTNGKKVTVIVRRWFDSRSYQFY